MPHQGHIDTDNLRPVTEPDQSMNTATIPAWELNPARGDLDASRECRRLFTALLAAKKATLTLRDLLDAKVAKHGSGYLDLLREADAGAYSMRTIDARIAQILEDVEFCRWLLTATDADIAARFPPLKVEPPGRRRPRGREAAE
ncbi:MAG: hypothetical protein AAFX65_11645 [Cyanobacteria bacterium J06638_7]